MRLQFLGTGGAFTRSSTNFHNNALLTIGGDRYLIDCSLTALESLDEIGIDPMDLSGVILTHMHGDHDSGLEELGFRGKFLGPDRRFDLYVHPSLLPSRSGRGGGPDLWENRLKGGMMHIQDAERNPVEADLETYFKPHAEEKFSIGEADLRFVRTDHVPNKDSFGIIVEEGDASFFFTADARPMFLDKPDLYTEPDAVFHDCMFMPHYGSTVHSHLEELLELPPEIQGKTYVMHYGDAAEWDNLNTEHLQIAKKHEEFEF